MRILSYARNITPSRLYFFPSIAWSSRNIPEIYDLLKIHLMNACKYEKKWIHLPEIHSSICDSFVCVFVFLIYSCLLVLISSLACMGLKNSDCLFISLSFPSFLSFLFPFLPIFFSLVFLSILLSCVYQGPSLWLGNMLNFFEKTWENRRRKQKCRNGMNMGKFYNKVTSLLHIPNTVIKIRDSHFQKNYLQSPSCEPLWHPCASDYKWWGSAWVSLLNRKQRSLYLFHSLSLSSVSCRKILLSHIRGQQWDGSHR